MLKKHAEKKVVLPIIWKLYKAYTIGCTVGIFMSSLISLIILGQFILMHTAYGNSKMFTHVSIVPHEYAGQFLEQDSLLETKKLIRWFFYEDQSFYWWW